MKKVIIVPVWESEKGWGQKIDDYMVCLSKEDAIDFVSEFNAVNNKPVTPDWYMYATSDFKEIEITDVQFEYLTLDDQGSVWLSVLKGKM